MDFGVYDLDFLREGRRRVYLFSYVLGYSRRQYLRFVESMDLPTTLREHVRAFHHLGGPARVCLYDNFKAVVVRHDADGVLYNPRFLAFATHYGFRPQACRVRRPQTKGKVERRFLYVETSLLNGRTFETLDHLNEVTAWWLAHVADVRTLRDFQESPLVRHQRERPLLLSLPASDFDTALVVYRHVNVEGYVTHRTNLYSVPWSFIGQVLPVRVTDREVVIYSVALVEIARHPLVGGKRDRRAANDQEPPSRRRSRPARLALAPALRGTRPQRRGFPRRPAGQAGPGQATSTATPGRWSLTTSRDDVTAGRWSGRCVSVPSRWRRSGASLPQGPGPERRWTSLPSCAATCSIRVCAKNRSGPGPPARTRTCSYRGKAAMKSAKKNRPSQATTTNHSGPREQVRADFATLRVPVTAEQLDAALKQAQDAGLSHLDFLHRLLADQAGLRRQRAIERRIGEARFRDARPLCQFDWTFNPTISRVQMETFATGDFVRRRQNLVFVGQSGVGKSFLIQSIGLAACRWFRVRYITSGELLEDLTAALADQTIHERVRHYARFELLVIDEFGFDRIERSLCPQAASLWYKIIDARNQRGSTALVTNIDFEGWADYLGDAPLAMALLDRVVDGATIVKLKGKSYRVHRSGDKPAAE